MDIAYEILTIMACRLPVMYVIYVYRSALQGMGNTLMPMVSGMAGIRVGFHIELDNARRTRDIQVAFLCQPAEGVGCGDKGRWRCRKTLARPDRFLQICPIAGALLSA